MPLHVADRRSQVGPLTAWQAFVGPHRPGSDDGGGGCGSLYQRASRPKTLVRLRYVRQAGALRLRCADVRDCALYGLFGLGRSGEGTDARSRSSDNARRLTLNPFDELSAVGSCSLGNAGRS